MPAPRFVHLRMHSEFSVADGIVRVDEAVKQAVADGMPALAITDMANVFGMVKFYGAARGAGLKPLVGADCWLQNEADRDKPHRLLLLCQTRAGYLRLCELLSRAWLTNQHRARAEIAASWLEEGGTEGLIALSGASHGDVGQALLGGHNEAAERHARAWAKLFPNRYYLELQRAGQPNAEALVQRTVALATQVKLPVVATHPVQFMAPDDFKAHEARVCIAQGYVLGDQRWPKLFTPDQYFKSQAEMAKLFADVPQALENSIEIARRCNLAIELGKSRLPAFPTPNGESIDDFLNKEAQAGLARRFEKLALEEKDKPRYRERLAFEIKTIVQMGYAGYFLIVADFINWAKHNGVPVGPGRGSGAGSLVAYALGITDLDPLRYDLLFERFLNPERVSLPDFDVDFCMDRRDEVFDYVAGKYGRDRVSQIITYGTMAAKAVLRDTGRVLGMPYGQVDRIAKLLPKIPLDLSLEDALGRSEKSRKESDRVVSEFKALYASDEEVKELVDLALKLEDLTRNAGKHAGGVVIAPGPLSDYAPLFSEGGGEGLVTQFDKDDVEAVGLVKFDFLGLRTLTIIDWTVKAINARRRERGEALLDIAA